MVAMEKSVAERLNYLQRSKVMSYMKSFNIFVAQTFVDIVVVFTSYFLE